MTSPVLDDPTLDFLRHLWALGHALERLSVLMDRNLGVTAQQRLVLRCLELAPGATAGELAEMLHLDPGTVSTHLRRLVQKRLIDRERDPRDGRRVKLVLTTRARRLVSQTQGTVEHAVSRMLARTSSRDVVAAKKTLAMVASLIGDERPRRRKR